MGNLGGHVGSGFGFFIIGLWHLLNHIKLHAQNPNSHKPLLWFPTQKLRYLELYLIMGGSTVFIALELFITPQRHQPLDTDFTIPSNHLHNFEHSVMALAFFTYAAFAVLLDRMAPRKTRHSLTQLLGAVAFGQQLLVFHHHSADHVGVEGEYHLLLQLVVSIALITTLMGCGYPKSFLISFVRSMSILFIGVWLTVIGFMLWTPELIPKGCFMKLEEGRRVVRCHNDEALERAKSLVVIEFSWYLVLVIISSMCLYLYMIRIYGEKVEYQTLSKKESEEDEEGDVEAQKRSKVDESKSFVQTGS
ncbi:hypothetical protein RHGRI_038177 [Rhododendron griersonianum]|uniref:Uncharacterized protein n=1 Tax=Rhododendron griersonianum TaxID=479676 RepID=A0AAV6HXX7_9ERIC|nr:hypothetical protein RHGRI_038177 [Rhododendron griersonianum]